jgi:uncharacterized phage-associated protein
MKTIRFHYDQDKVMNALAFFSRKGVADLDQMKSSKLLFLADRAHLLRYGRTITGDTYVCMEHGPAFPEIGAALAARSAAKRNAIPIPFESFFDPSAPMIEFIRQDQDDRDFAESMTWQGRMDGNPRPLSRRDLPRRARRFVSFLG